MPGIYDDVRDLAKQLEASDHTAWAERLIIAMRRGCTSGEILMELRWQLRELLRADKDLPEAMEATCERLIREIDATGV